MTAKHDSEQIAIYAYHNFIDKQHSFTTSIIRMAGDRHNISKTSMINCLENAITMYDSFCEEDKIGNCSVKKRM